MRLENLPEEFVRALPVLEKLNLAGFETYFVGGCVRDALLGRAIHDVDIATSAYPAEVKAIFPKTIDIGIEHGTVLVLMGKSEAEHYEVTTFRTESDYTDYRRPDHVDFVRDLREDLRRRDFTVNAFACGADGEIIDLFDGLQDLQDKRLRAVGLAEERFNEDALRIMRAMRFAAALGFEIEPMTFQAMMSHAELLMKISIERIFVELDKLLRADGWRKGLSVLIESGAWQYLPDFELAGLKKFLTVLSKTFQFKSSAQAWAIMLAQFDNISVKKYLRKWKVSNEFIRDVTALTEAHQLDKWDLASVYKFGLATCQLVDDWKMAEGLKIDFDRTVKIDERLQIHDKSEIVVKGSDLIKMGFQAGPELGKMLAEIEEKIVNNEWINKREFILEKISTVSGI
ncbi:CCA tRNA nucleotidyltransferase [Lactococcus nasutitermitis]|uniref:CCA-adding enzyme n=1 Tax=Lactococcus nasutitermitis TaxID=1652957 RepID=A0ABV9JE31_9LACT|nr:CCA tRNA nucleotidyltransferase [Lactococcus nasutitermitis]